MTTHVIMMAKAPVPGTVKTRLGETIGLDWSARFHAAFIHDLCDTIAATDFDATLSFTGDRDHDGFSPARELGFAFEPQPEGDLGRRLTDVARYGFERADRVLIIGSDSPTLSVEMLQKADIALHTRDVVIGPSFDGGYYLIGFRSDCFKGETGPDLHLFRDISWSSRTVLKETLKECETHAFRCQLIDFWYDVDTKEDLEFMEGHLSYLTGQKEVARHTRAVLESFAQNR